MCEDYIEPALATAVHEDFCDRRQIPLHALPHPSAGKLAIRGARIPARRRSTRA